MEQETFIILILLFMLMPEVVGAGVMAYIVATILGPFFISIELWLIMLIVPAGPELESLLVFWTPYYAAGAAALSAYKLSNKAEKELL